MASGFRAEKRGFARDVQKKLAEKYNEAEAAKVITWISLIPHPTRMPYAFVEAVKKLPKHSETLDSSEFFNILNNGMVLGYLMGCLDEAQINQLSSSKTWQESQNPAFKMSRERDRIGTFLKFAGSYGVDSAFLFQTEQLYEQTNLIQVVNCLNQLGIQAQTKPNFSGPKDYWVQKSRENKRSFTAEQLRSGEGVIGLQMGTNKGANASGVSFGSRRHITDNF